MKHNLSISQTAMEDLKNSLDPDVFNALYKKLVDQKSRSYIS
jgi:queuine/archaeosine tRNA-ribosyltransferase